MTSILRGKVRGLASVLDAQSLFIYLFIYFFVIENWICAITRHYAEPNNILLIKKFWFDVRQWSHRLMITVHCLWAKSNNRAPGQSECEVAWFCFWFWFRLFACSAWLLFHSLFTFSRCVNKTGWLQNEY